MVSAKPFLYDKLVKDAVISIERSDAIAQSESLVSLVMNEGDLGL